jgi:hypothetical protein
MTTGYTDVFGGANIYPSEISYSEIALDQNVTLFWPEETSTSDNLATRIIDVIPSAGGLSIVLPNADKTGTGNTILFNNKGGFTFTVLDADLVQIAACESGTVWQVYLNDNTTISGDWTSLQYGASISSANASALAGTGLVAIGTLLSQSIPVTLFNSDYSAGINDRAKAYVWNGAGSGVLTLPSAATFGNNWFMYVRNNGGGQLTVTPSGSSVIDSGASKYYQPGESSIIASDGIDYFTIGFGQPSVFVFDYTVIDIPGLGDYTLSGSELNRIVYKFTGVLTGNRSVSVPDTVQQYWIDNSTTGSYDLTIKTVSGTGVIIQQNARSILYSNGANVIDADTATISYPIAVNQGGTGSTTANGALINLGATSLGLSLFTAVDQNAAWSVLGNQPIISGGTF